MNELAFWQRYMVEKFVITFFRVLVLVGLLTLSACDPNQQPSGADLSIAPNNRTFDVVETHDANGACQYFEQNVLDLPLLLVLSDGQGSPIGGATLGVNVDFAANNYAGLNVLALYSDDNGNGVIDGDTELVSGVDDPAYETKTATYSGERLLYLRVNLSCAFRGEVFAYAGAATASMSVEVTARAEGAHP